LNCASIRYTGFSAFMLLWNTVEMSRQRIWRSFSSAMCVISLPSKRTRPPLITPGGKSRRRMALPSVDLPLPDSPTRPMNSPGSSAKVTSRTASIGGRDFVA